MLKIWNWLVTSSADPNKVALTVKGFLGTAVSLVLFVSPILHLSIGADQLNIVVDAIIQIIVIGCGIISALVTIIGFIRKIYLTIKS